MKSTPDSIITEATDLKIAVLSGKGGTGKTLVSVNLAAAAERATYLDCDVEEPNGHLFFKPESLQIQPVKVKIPQVDATRCSGCRICVEFCRFNALAYVNDRLLIFKDVCHSCGGCMLACPENALTEIEKNIGQVESGNSEGIKVVTGRMNPGEASGVPIIKEVLKQGTVSDELTLIDCPPGSACVVMESIKDADYCLLVAEPTLFGAHNLKMVHELVGSFKKPCGVVLNKTQMGINPSEAYCRDNDVSIIGTIPYDRYLGEINSNGQIVSRRDSAYHDVFREILDEILQEVEG